MESHGTSAWSRIALKLQRFVRPANNRAEQKRMELLPTCFILEFVPPRPSRNGPPGSPENVNLQLYELFKLVWRLLTNNYVDGKLAWSGSGSTQDPSFVESRERLSVSLAGGSRPVTPRGSLWALNRRRLRNLKEGPLSIPRCFLPQSA